MEKEKKKEKEEKESKKEEKKETKKEAKKEEKKKEKRERIIAVPGEIIASGPEFLPGEGTRREGKDILAMKFGLLDKKDKLVKVIPLTGAYIPRVGNTVIGQIVDITFNGWIVDILSPHLAFLSMTEYPKYISKNDLSEYYNFKDNILTKIKAVKSRSVELTMKERGLRKLEGGMLLRINSTRVPRVIGRAGSMVNTIKDETGCNITIGQNGIIWLKGKKMEDELLAREAIELIVKQPFIDGLTEKVKTFLSEKKKEKKSK